MPDTLFRRTPITIAQQVFYVLPLALFLAWGIQSIETFISHLTGWRRMWPRCCLDVWTSARLSILTLFTSSLQDIFEILRKQLRKNTACKMVMLVVALRFWHVYKVEERKVDMLNGSFTFRLITLDPKTFWSCLKPRQAFSIQVLISF